MAGAPLLLMATRMTTLLFGSERGVDTAPLPIHAPASRVSAGEDQVAVRDTEIMPGSRTPSTPVRWDDSLPSIPPPIMKRPFPAFPAMTAGLLSTAALWLGLALFVIAVAYPMGDFARAALTLIGTSMMAAVIAFAMTSRPEYA
jgi:hypothetical protein